MSEVAKEVVKRERPEFTNIHVSQLSNYRLPLAGFVSILHRVSGLLMAFLLPFILYLFDLSLISETSYEHLMGIASAPLAKLVLLALAWAYLHHFCAGLRHLVMDNHIGLDKDSARKSSVAVFAVSLSLALVVAFKLFGAQ